MKKYQNEYLSISNSYLNINLQLFADDGDKTEKATAKKRQDARKKGQVLKSNELTSTLVLTLVFGTLKALGNYIYTHITSLTIQIIQEFSEIDDMTAINEINRIFKFLILEILKIIGPIMAVALVSGVLISYIQVGSLLTFEPLKPKFSKLNPLKGLKRIFSVKGLVELVKSLLKIIIVGAVAYSALKAQQKNIVSLMDMDIISIGSYILGTAIDIALMICAAMLVLAAIDFLYQWWQYEKDLKMSKQEIKEEYKQVEGNPEIKSKIKQKQREISMRRMMDAVPEADVVITNPTHFAVVIKYDPEKGDAPILLAKGQDFIALRIKEIAKENNVEIVENKPLARALYSSVDIGQAIPPEHYQAVAEILAFVYSLKGTKPN